MIEKGDERQRKIHAESARNAFAVATAVTGALLVWDFLQTGELDLELMAILLSTQIMYTFSILYYLQNGLKDSLSVSSLGSN